MLGKHSSACDFRTPSRRISKTSRVFSVGWEHNRKEVEGLRSTRGEHGGILRAGPTCQIRDSAIAAAGECLLPPKAMQGTREPRVYGFAMCRQYSRLRSRPVALRLGGGYTYSPLILWCLGSDAFLPNIVCIWACCVRHRLCCRHGAHDRMLSLLGRKPAENRFFLHR